MTTVYKPTAEYRPEYNTKIEKPSFMSGLIAYGQRKIYSRENTAAGSLLVYEVPAGKVFFMVSAHLVATRQGFNNPDIAKLYLNTSTETLLTLYPVIAWTPDNISAAFSIPLKMTAGEKIYISSVVVGATLPSYVFGAILGYEVDAAVVPNFT